jgi:Tfp pilus assembly protein PilX
MDKQTTYRASERGVALIFALLAILVLSILAAAIMITSQSQSWTAINYRLTAQARYAAEAGVQSSMNWLSSATYSGHAITFASYDMTKNPVQYNGKAVVLSNMSGVTSNYPDATVVTAYSALGSSLPGVANTSYSTYATLLRMSPSSGVSWLPGTGGSVVQTWQITSQGAVGGVRSASVQVAETFERTGTPIFAYGLEATGSGCGALKFAGKDYTDSYNSSIGVYTSQTPGTQGNVATNGNVTLAGSGANAAKINGNVAAVNNTVGACPGAGLTDSSSGNYGTLKAVSPPLSPPLPWGCTTTPCYPPGTLVTAAQNVSTACASIPGCTKNTPATISLFDGGSAKTVNAFTLAPGSYGNITINAADVVHVSAGTYNINSINFATDGQFVVDSGPVVFNMVGNCASGCPTESGLPSGYSSTEIIYGAGYAGFNGCAPSGGTGVVANPNVYGSTTCGPSKTPYSGIPNNLQIVYGGTDTMRLGGMPNALVLYAPQAGYYTPGAPVGLYGSAVVKNFDDESGSPFHYDTGLQNSVMQVGQYRPVGGFSWSKF